MREIISEDVVRQRGWNCNTPNDETGCTCVIPPEVITAHPALRQPLIRWGDTERTQSRLPCGGVLFLDLTNRKVQLLLLRLHLVEYHMLKSFIM